MEDKHKQKQFSRNVLSRGQAIIVAGMVLLSTSAGFVGGWLGASSHSQQAERSDEGSARRVVLNENQVISNIAEEVGQSVVSVNVLSQNPRNDFFGFCGPVPKKNAGKGFFLSEDGIVLTNRHVVPSNAARVSVTLSDGTELDNVEVVGRTSSADPLDVAFLKINDTKGKTLKPVELGNSSEIEVGARVVAIGNALGQFQNTVTTGIISGYGRSVQAYDETGTDTLQNLFQTDAAINEGNSGGPLVDINGKVIAINTAVAAGGAENIGFAIPIDDVKGLIASVLDTGKLLRPYLGVRYVQLTDDYAYELDLETKRGAYILPGRDGRPSILPDSPAKEAGLKEGDIITEVNGVGIDEKHSLVSLIGSHKVGDKVTLTIVRDGREQTVEATLEASPE